MPDFKNKQKKDCFVAKVFAPGGTTLAANL